MDFREELENLLTQKLLNKISPNLSFPEKVELSLIGYDIERLVEKFYVEKVDLRDVVDEQAAEIEILKEELEDYKGRLDDIECNYDYILDERNSKIEELEIENCNLQSQVDDLELALEEMEIKLREVGS